MLNGKNIYWNMLMKNALLKICLLFYRTVLMLIKKRKTNEIQALKSKVPLGRNGRSISVFTPTDKGILSRQNAK